MNIENTAVSAASPSTQPQLSGGLYLKGTVIAVRTEAKEWEKEKYTQTTVEVSDGEPFVRNLQRVGVPNHLYEG